MKKYMWTVIGSLALVTLSAIMYSVHYYIFGQLESTLYYTFLDLCFIPLNILIVTLVFNKILDRRAKRERINKINMLVGIFFSELGYSLMELLIKGDKNTVNFIDNFSNLKDIERKIKTHTYAINLNMIDLTALEQLLLNNKDMLITLIGNESILEHETFTDLLMATTHLRDEIAFRKNREFTDEDYTHIKGDILRVYKAITLQWIDYLKHLKQFYPYLYTGAIQLNPYNGNVKKIC